jgi:hypothetical protein
MRRIVIEYNTLPTIPKSPADPLKCSGDTAIDLSPRVARPNNFDTMYKGFTGLYKLKGFKRIFILNQGVSDVTAECAVHFSTTQKVLIQQSDL